MFQLPIRFILVSCLIPMSVFAQIGQKSVHYQVTMPGVEQTIPSQPVQAENYTAVDSYAKSAPEFGDDMPKLVEYLIKPYQNNDLLKTRVLFAWMVYHLNYDQFRADNINGKTRDGKQRFLNRSDAFKTRVGVCGDFADLFVKMAARAGLKAARIDGVAGEELTRLEVSRAKHAWNAVQIDKKWHLLDVTWAMTGDYTIFDDVQKVNTYKKMMRERRRHQFVDELTVSKNRQINNKWFLTDPEIMIETHFPNSLKWQLLDKPITPHDVFKQNEKKVESRQKLNSQPIKMIMPK